jgi:hypothetical protein
LWTFFNIFFRVTGNNFFLASTGFTIETVTQATIFGLVQRNKLSNLFEIVAKSLRTKSQIDDDYLAVTLPCIKFKPSNKLQLYITVTLMADEDPRKRCFHCVLSDTPGTKEAIGPITPELLEMMFSTGGGTNDMMTLEVKQSIKAEEASIGFEKIVPANRVDVERIQTVCEDEKL